MFRCVITLTLLVGFTANLLLPRQLVRESACFSSGCGKAAGSCHRHSESGQPTLSAPRTCCDPIVIQLPVTADLQVGATLSSNNLGALNDFHFEAPHAALVMLGEMSLAPHVWATGPPQSVDILARHSRLNL